MSRTNIYAEELTTNIQCVSKKIGERKYYGLRLYLKSHPALSGDSGGDQSAVTLWFDSHIERHSYTNLMAACAVKGIDREQK